MSVPSVSVLMAVYNGEKHIRPTIESILNQTFTDFEFLIVNDASTDSTLDILTSYRDPRIILHNNIENLGQTKSLNVGLHIAKGEYIARTDAGDVSAPIRLQKQVSYIQEHPNITVLGTSAFRYDESGRIIDVVTLANSPTSMLQRIFFASPTVHISVLMNRKKILQLGGYDEDYHVLADYELWSRLLRNGHQIVNLKEVLAGYMFSLESFGNINALSRSIIEASKIIKTNVKKLTNTSISLEQATNVYKMLSLNMHDMNIADVILTEKLITTILRNMLASKREIDYILFRPYIKYVLFNIRKRKEKQKFQYVLKASFMKITCMLALERFYETFSRLRQSALWRLKGDSVNLDFGQ